MTLKTTVTNILNRKVTEQQAMQWANDNYGVLATYIRQQFINSLKTKKNEHNRK